MVKKGCCSPCSSLHGFCIGHNLLESVLWLDWDLLVSEITQRQIIKKSDRDGIYMQHSEEGGIMREFSA